jgi:hypothetical protein
VVVHVRSTEKVFKKMGFMISPVDIEAVVQCKRHAIERILLLIQNKIGEYQQTTANGTNGTPGVAWWHGCEAHRITSHPALFVRLRLEPLAPPPAIATSAPKYPSPKHQPAPQAAPAAKKAAAPKQPQQQPPSPTRKAVAAPQQQQQQQSAAIPNGKLSGDKDATIHDLRETVDILQLKVQKLEQLLRLKNSKIESLQKKMSEITGQPLQ